MYHHVQLGTTQFGRLRVLYNLIKNCSITFAGYSKGKIYGRLNCNAGKRMKPENRVFFTSEAEAMAHGYRPCGSCMRSSYLQWKKRQPN
jgi:methylphosphotriester-DNA--protein-cysteine methyltransferase